MTDTLQFDDQIFANDFNGNWSLEFLISISLLELSNWSDT